MFSRTVINFEVLRHFHSSLPFQRTNAMVYLPKDKYYPINAERNVKDYWHAAFAFM